jgi:hypothetical protein
MRRFLRYFLGLLPLSVIAGAAPMPDVSQTPPVLFLKSWLGQEKAAGEPTGPHIRFRFGEHLVAAVRDQDRPLVRELLPLYVQAFESEVQIASLEQIARTQLAERATLVADQLQALVAILGERAVGGIPGQIERETLGAASLPFEVAAAENLSQRESWRRRLARLGAKPDGDILPLPPRPSSSDAASLAATSPALRILDLLTERRLASLDSLDFSQPSWEPVFVEPDSPPANVRVPFVGQDRFSDRAGLQENARLALVEAIQRRLDAIASLQRILHGFPEEKLARMLAVAELADRQYRQGAIPITLLIETQKTVFEAQSSRTQAVLNLWRETLELWSLAPASRPPAGG